MARIADYLELLLLDVVRRPIRPAFTRLADGRRSQPDDPARRGSGVYLGTRPDYSSDSKDGMRIDGVSEGSPAEKAGLKGGDVITSFGGKAVGTIYDFMDSMNRYKPGDQVEILVKRDGKVVKLQVTLGSRSRQ
jgi:S1-C subfamily serine protease